jgi:prepilin-type N-terminal cleavage/methylation domain-containing protein
VNTESQIGALRVRAPHRRGGFTLLEVMLAISVMLITLVAAVSSQITSMNLVRSTRESNTAMADLQTAMEELLLSDAEDLPLDFPPGTPLAAFTGLNLDGEAITPTYPGWGGGPVTDSIQIVLTMTWNDWRGRPMQMRLATMRVR